MFKNFSIKQEINDDINASNIFSIGTYVVLFVVATVMTIINIFTDKGFLTCCTGTFAVLCIINIVLTLIGNNANKIARFLFAIEVLCLFTFFLVSGNPEGFSSIWICLLPSVSMYFYNRFKGTLLCFAMFLLLAFFLWTSFGNQFLMYQYTSTFKMRFPVLFVAFHILAFFLESRRVKAEREMRRLQDYYRDLSSRDSLTNIYNRQGMFSVLSNDVTYTKASKLYVAMFDIDDFKHVNDEYGHDAGDVVLKTFTEILNKNLKGLNCRWGGEEFIAVLNDKAFNSDDLEKVRVAFEKYQFGIEGKNYNVTVSIGVSSSDTVSSDSIDALISEADEALYKAKNSGKNIIVYYNNN